MNAAKYLMAGTLALTLVNAASARRYDPAIDRSAAAKASGQAFAGQQVQTYQQHAQDRSQILYYYYQQQQPVPKQEAKELVAGIRQDLTAADKALAKIKAAHPHDQAVLKQIASIEGHHKRAHEVCGMAEKECLKQHGDHVAMGDCCSEMWHEIDAAKAETDKLFKTLKIEKLEPPKKPAAHHEHVSK